MVVCTSHPTTAVSINRQIMVQAGPGIKQDPVSKITKTKRTGDMAQVE
jgi:hypothetical protein